MAVVSNPLGGLFKVPDLGDTGFSEIKTEGRFTPGSSQEHRAQQPARPGLWLRLSPRPQGGGDRSARGQEAPAPTPSSRSAPGAQRPPRPSLPAQRHPSQITHGCCQHTKEPMSHASAQGTVRGKSDPSKSEESGQTPSSLKTPGPPV